MGGPLRGRKRGAARLPLKHLCPLKRTSRSGATGTPARALEKPRRRSATACRPYRKLFSYGMAPAFHRIGRPSVERRKFVQLAAGAAGTTTFTARAQQKTPA